MRFLKYHAAANDYLVLADLDAQWRVTAEFVQRICDRHRGLGGDGILVGRIAPDSTHHLRIFNPDGSEAEKSGNGARIFARYLWDFQRVGNEPFDVHTPGGKVTCQVQDDGKRVRAEMGRASFRSRDLSLPGPDREVLNEVISVDGSEVWFSAVSLGNPHCVVFCERVTEQEARRWGPSLESHPLFPRRTNVQFVRVIDRSTIQIEIWERGAGYTLSSGTSSCAAVAVAHRLGHVDPAVRVRCQGGELLVEVLMDGTMVLIGPVARVAECWVDVNEC